MTRTEIRQKANSEMEKRRLRAEAEAEARRYTKNSRRWRRYAECWQEQLPSFLSL